MSPYRVPLNDSVPGSALPQVKAKAFRVWLICWVLKHSIFNTPFSNAYFTDFKNQYHLVLIWKQRVTHFHTKKAHLFLYINKVTYPPTTKTKQNIPGLSSITRSSSKYPLLYIPMPTNLIDQVSLWSHIVLLSADNKQEKKRHILKHL